MPIKLPSWIAVKDEVMTDDNTTEGFRNFSSTKCNEPASQKCWNTFEKLSEDIYNTWKIGVESAKHFYRGIAISNAQNYVADLVKNTKPIGVSWTYNPKLAAEFAKFAERWLPLDPIQKRRKASEGVVFTAPCSRISATDIDIPWSVGTNINWQMKHTGRSEDEVRFARKDIYIDEVCLYPSQKCVPISQKFALDE